MRSLISSLLLLFILQAASAQAGEYDSFTSDRPVDAWSPDISASQKAAWTLLLGKWHGSQPTKEGGVRQEIAEHYPDGTLRITFRTYDADGAFVEDTEVLQWGISGPVYFTFLVGWLGGDRFHPANPADPQYQDAYRIIELTGEVFEYEHFATGGRYVLRRVADDFEFPDEQL